jgi:cytochrome c
MRAYPLGAALLCALVFGASAPAQALPQGDPARGEKIYERCNACHSIDRDRTGPHHAGLFGRRAGSVPGFAYSPAMKKAGTNGLVWNEITLDKFLQAPTKFIPGTRMGYAGIKDDQERADLLAYLRQATATTAATEMGAAK